MNNMDHLNPIEIAILKHFLEAEQTGDSDKIVGVYEMFLDKFQNDAEYLAYLGIVVNDSCWRLAETEKVLLKGTDQEKAVQKVDRIFRENKPEDFQMIVNEADEMAAEKYDEKTGYFEQYVVFIEVERLNF